MAQEELTGSSIAGRGQPFKGVVEHVGEDIVTYEDRAAKIWLYSSIAWFAIGTLVGLTIATELISPNLFGGVAFLEFGRMRPIHVNTVLLAWLTMVDFGAIFYIMPRLLGVHKMWNETLGYWAAWAYNIMLVGGLVGIGLGWTIGKEYWEFIWPVDVLFYIVWLVNVVNILMTVVYRRARALYVSVWWCMASPIWLAADYWLANNLWKPGSLLGNGIPGGALSGSLSDPLADVMMNWWGAHNLFGMWLTPMLIAITYYLVPRITGTPLYSHTLSLVSFWGIAFVYTSVGGHHLLQAPIPVWDHTFATVYSIMLLVPVFAFIFNIVLTMRGNWGKFMENLPLRFCIVGFFFYFFSNPQGSFQAIQVFDRFVHFTNMTVAHAHLALLGGMAMGGNAIIYYAIPQILKKPIYSRRLANVQFWLITIGFLIFFFSLMSGGFIQGYSWLLISQPEVNILPLLHPFYIARAVGGGMVFVSALVQFYNIFMTVIADTRAKRSASMKSTIMAAAPVRTEV